LSNGLIQYSQQSTDIHQATTLFNDAFFHHFNKLTVTFLAMLPWTSGGASFAAEAAPCITQFLEKEFLFERLHGKAGLFLICHYYPEQLVAG